MGREIKIMEIEEAAFPELWALLSETGEQRRALARHIHEEALAGETIKMPSELRKTNPSEGKGAL
jgi:hypothetical protein